ncbi:hypothetical protein C8D92_102241 [Tamilnaduibacter salinus]|uniref:Uncharacterized protein n=1 Tax=Tamilnaduibacter salinus TaxID=1484056 RepID=A0A2A2I4R0_9GAMM|nr:hypothetical protein [Tamilnaduibacter salinus]PAV26378.1 hypothetical protein CF392_05940 [Tamilnaduibacter salinus]PVY78201.1 hypothetical protein C8D92_102241 [Tamilnaduibacter salinus]
MAFWQELLITIIAVGGTTAAVLFGFFRWVLRPYLNQKVRELQEAADAMPDRVSGGVREGFRQSLQDLPENTVRESTRNLMRFGSGLMENGLSAFLGEVETSARDGSGRDRR